MLVLKYVETKSTALFLCQCDCGNTKVASGSALRHGAIISCGCAKKERMKALGSGPEARERGRKMGEANKGKPQATKRIIPCLRCTADFHPSHTHVRFCSISCAVRWRHETGEPPLHWHGTNWDAQSRLARERDDHTCQECGKRRTWPGLDIHHIRPRWMFASQEEANALDNLVTLCKSCHATIEQRRSA